MRQKITFILLLGSLICNVAAIAFYILDQKSVPPQNFPLLDISRNYIDQKYFIVNFVPLRKELEEYLTKYPNYRISVYFEYLHTGSFIWLNQTERIPPASLAKLPVAMVMLNEIEQGKYQLEDTYTLKETDKDPRWGNLYQSQVGTKLTWRKLIEASLIDSDNTAHNILYNTISTESAKEFGTKIGIEQLFDQSGNTSVREMARMYRALYTASYLNRNHSQLVLEILQQATYRDLLRHKSEYPIASKFGIDPNLGVYNEAGIVFIKDRPYILSILIQAKDQPQSPIHKSIAQEIMSSIQQRTTSYIFQTTGD